jgi:hypothetical protein
MMSASHPAGTADNKGDIMNNSLSSSSARRQRVRRVSQLGLTLIAAIATAATALAVPTETASASGYTIAVPDSGAAACNARTDTITMAAAAYPSGNGQYLSTRFSVLDQTTGRRVTSGFSPATWITPKSTAYGAPLDSLVGTWQVNGAYSHTYRVQVQIARWTGSRWSYDPWTLAGHKIDLNATQTNIYGQVINNMMSFTLGNCRIL